MSEEPSSILPRLKSFEPRRKLNLSGESKKEINLELLRAQDNKLHETKEKLKIEFAGLDKEIDQIFEMIRPWYLMPASQQRPLVVSLWGMTGVGKTSFVRRLVDLLEVRERFIEKDLGSFSGTTYSYSDALITYEAYRFSGKPAVLLFDEVHNVRTMSVDGMEIDRPLIREFWSLLDSGILPINVQQYRDQVISLRRIIEDSKKESIYPTNYYPLDESFLELIINLLGLNVSNDELYELAKQNTEQVGLWLIEQFQWFVSNAKSLDFTQSLIFVLGNLDELFTDSTSINPDDINAEELYENTRSISGDQVRQSLLTRFRPEQVGRLCGTQIIFPSLSRASFEKIIRLRLKSLVSWVKSDFDLNLKFDESIVEFIFKEGVLPSQGARPVLTSIKEIIESKTSKWILAALEKSVKSFDVSFDFHAQNLIVKGPKDSDFTIEERVALRVEKLPEKNMSEALRMILAVHEAGHAVVGLTSYGMMPTKILVGPLSWHRGGPRVVFKPFEFYSKRICQQVLKTLLAGRVAEELVLGEEQISLGAEQDLWEATSLVARMITSNAMAEHIGVSLLDPHQPAALRDRNEQDDALKEKYLQEAKKGATETLKKQWPLFQALVEALMKKDRLTVTELSSIVEKHYSGSDEEIKKLLARKSYEAYEAYDIKRVHKRVA